MAHGEMVMLGAYTTFVVQDIIRTSAPHLFDASLVIALPLAFLVAGGIGILSSAASSVSSTPAARYPAGDVGPVAGAAAGVRSIFGPSTARLAHRPSCRAPSRSDSSPSPTALWIVVFSLVVFAT